MYGVWGNNLHGEKNVTLAFTLGLKTAKSGIIKIAGADCFKIYSEEKLIYFGPSRAAHGYARQAEVPFTGKRITVVVHSHYVNQFCWIKQPPFFACEVTAENNHYTAEDFKCYHLNNRIRKMQRYSFQRGFAESYIEEADFNEFLRGKPIYEEVEKVKVQIPEILQTYNENPKLGLHDVKRIIEKGGVKINQNAELFRDRAMFLRDEVVEGFAMEDWEIAVTDDASKFVYLPNSKEKCEYTYTHYDFGHSITGFINAEVRVKPDTEMYIIFDEILFNDPEKGKNYLDFTRNETANAIKWTFKKGGTFHISNFDPYTLRYAIVVIKGDIKLKTINITDYENPSVNKFKFKCENKQIKKIVEAARATLAQNSPDILMDCPSRERAGWLSDAWFSSVAEKLFTGGNAAEKTFLENYALCSRKYLPKGMIPMCYPSDHPDKNYIPNWAMWYIAEIFKYFETYGKDDLVEKSKFNVIDVLEYFKTFENEEGLLENLQGWIFVEWSDANEWNHIRGVNVPSNACYGYVLWRAGQMYGIEEYITKSEKIFTKIKELAFDGQFFVDNLVRDENGALVRNGVYTEVCQYYLFRFYCITRREYPELYKNLMDNFGSNRKEGYMPQIGMPNVMYGVYMRLDLLTEDGKRKEVLDECLKLFTVMAKRTGTLWEHTSPKKSCNHGFASYAMRWIIFALTGYDIRRERFVKGKSLKIDCEMKIPDVEGGYMEITVKNGKMTVNEVNE